MRRTRDYRLESRESRSKLRKTDRPYYRVIVPGLFLGYRKGKKGGVWSGRKWTGEKYEKWQLGMADDIADADGIEVLDFSQAHEKVGLGPSGGSTQQISTVNDVMEYYMIQQRAEARAAPQTQNSIDRHITHSIGKTKLSKLSADEIRKWRDDLADIALAQRKRIGSTKEKRRKRQASANRVLTMLKGALNYAESQGKYKGNAPWKLVKPFKNVDATEHPFLDRSQAIRLVNCCEPDFRQLVRATLETGCRYGELINMKVSDLNLDAGTVTIRESKSGKVRHSHLTETGLDFFAVAASEKKRSERLFLRQDGQPWGKSHQKRRMAFACKKAQIEPSISFKALRTTYGSLLALQGVPLQVIAAALGHADTRITEKHYAHLLPNYVADMIRGSLPTFETAEEKKRQLHSVV